MKLTYDEDFIESAVFRCASGRGGAVPKLQVSRFHREREQLYSILDPEERNLAFFKLHLEWFREWALAASLTETVQEFPLLSERLTSLVFRASRGKHDEGAELYVHPSGTRNGVLALRVDRFAQPESLARFIRHELMHLHDMVDPAFGYEPELPVPPGVLQHRRVTLERYRLLWDVAIDGRLTARGRPGLATREQRWAEFAASFSFWPEDQQCKVFAALWSEASPRHAELARLCCDPLGLQSKRGPNPGAPCPLCGFPTFDWAPEAELEQARPGILSEFPVWEAAQGACRRCATIYRLPGRAGSSLPVPLSASGGEGLGRGGLLPNPINPQTSAISPPGFSSL